MISQAQQDHFDSLTASFAEPRLDIRVQVGAKVLTRSLPKICPWCKNTFFGYQVEGEERQPYQQDPDVQLGRHGSPKTASGTRETCGHPLCWDHEDLYQFNRRMLARKAEADAAGVQPLLVKGKKL
jgi:hypothetical protein